MNPWSFYDLLLDRVAGADDPAEEAIALAAEQVGDIRDIADGVHVMPLGLDAAVGSILTG